ncbi:MAG: DUF1826 domain-containing protein [Pseudomonadota bacterium]
MKDAAIGGGFAETPEARSAIHRGGGAQAIEQWTSGLRFRCWIDALDPADLPRSQVILRGSLWPQEHRSRVLDRSPPIEGTDETRLIRVFDAMTKVEEDI